MNISQWKNGDRTFFSLEVDDRLLLLCNYVELYLDYIPALGRGTLRMVLLWCSPGHWAGGSHGKLSFYGVLPRTVDLVYLVPVYYRGPRNVETRMGT